jgi:hypothetical protein
MAVRGASLCSGSAPLPAPTCCRPGCLWQTETAPWRTRSPATTGPVRRPREEPKLPLALRRHIAAEEAAAALTRLWKPLRRDELLRGCVNLTAPDALPQCFTGPDLTLPELCAPAPGGFNLSALPAILAGGGAADGLPGSLCSPLAGPAPDVLGCTTPLRCTPSEVAPLGPAGFGFCGAADVSALGAAAAGGGRGKGGTCGTACIVGVVVGSAALAALLASLGWCAAPSGLPQ